MKLLILGTGAMAARHVEEFGAMNDVSVVAAVEPNANRLAAFCDTFKIPHAFHDLDAALAWNEFDAVANVTPDVAHYPTTMRLIAAGKHVFCEKPLATDYPHAREMTEEAEARGIVNMVNLTYRSAAALHTAREMVLSGHLGTIRHFEASYFQSWLVSKAWGDWHTDEKWLWRLSTAHGSKGVVGDIGIHIIDFATFAIGSDVASIAPRVRTYHKAAGDRIGAYALDANDSFVASVELQNGAIGAIEATRFATGNANELRTTIFGDKGAVAIHADSRQSSLMLCEGADIDTTTWRPVVCAPVVTTYRAFADAVVEGRTGDPPFRRAAEIQRVLDLILEHGNERGVPVTP